MGANASNYFKRRENSYVSYETIIFHINKVMRKRRPRGERKKNCSKCKNTIVGSRAGKQSYCKECHAEYMRNNRPKHGELSEEQRKRANARAYTKEYIKRGRLNKKPCEVCGEEKVEAHHDDYNKPLVVRWMCRKHHMEYHQKSTEENNQGL